MSCCVCPQEGNRLRMEHNCDCACLTGFLPQTVEHQHTEQKSSHNWNNLVLSQPDCFSPNYWLIWHCQLVKLLSGHPRKSHVYMQTMRIWMWHAKICEIAASTACEIISSESSYQQFSFLPSKQSRKQVSSANSVRGLLGSVNDQGAVLFYYRVCAFSLCF